MEQRSNVGNERERYVCIYAGGYATYLALVHRYLSADVKGLLHK